MINLIEQISPLKLFLQKNVDINILVLTFILYNNVYIHETQKKMHPKHFDENLEKSLREFRVGEIFLRDDCLKYDYFNY